MFQDYLNRLSTSSVKCWTVNYCIHTSKGPVIIMYQLKSLYNSPFKDSDLHLIHTCFAMIASNEYSERLYYVRSKMRHHMNNGGDTFFQKCAN